MIIQNNPKMGWEYMEPIYSRNIWDIQKDKEEFAKKTIEEIEEAVVMGPNLEPYPNKGKKIDALYREAQKLNAILPPWKWKEALILKHLDWEAFCKYVEKNKIVNWDMGRVIDFLVNKWTHYEK